MVHEYFGFVRFVMICLSNPPLKKVPTGTSINISNLNSPQLKT